MLGTYLGGGGGGSGRRDNSLKKWLAKVQPVKYVF